MYSNLNDSILLNFNMSRRRGACLSHFKLLQTYIEG